MKSSSEKGLTLAGFNEILFNGKELILNDAQVEKVEKNHEFLKEFSRHKLIYGINTGFGPMAQYKVSEENILTATI